MKIIRKLFDARSPMWQLIFALPFVAYLSYAAERATDPSGGFQFEADLSQFLMLAYLTLVGICASIVVRHYNKRHGGSKRLSMWQIHPPEAVSGDEMLEHASRSAARRVYLYNNLVLPVLATGVLFYRAFPLSIGLLLALYLTGYYLTYLWAIWPYLGED